jgi:hypothetical protein
MASDKIPSYNRDEETLSVFPKADQDVPAPPPDTLNEGALKMLNEHQDYQPKFPAPGKKG